VLLESESYDTNFNEVSDPEERTPEKATLITK
jgi:hypothetical protein